MELGALIEVTGAVAHQGECGLVQAIKDNTIIVHPVHVTETGYTSAGHCFEVSAGSVLQMPTQSDLRREKAALRAKNIAALKVPHVMPPPRVRVFKQYAPRHTPAEY